MSFPLQPAPPRRMPFDAAAFLRLDALQQRRHIAVGRRVRDVDRRHSRGLVLRPGVFRLRVGPETRARLRPRASRARRPARSRAGGRAPGRSPRANRRSSSPARRCACACLHRGVPVLASMHRRAVPRVDAASGVRPPAPGRPMDRRVRARVRRARLRTRREIRPARQARTARPFAGRRRARRQHGAVVQERAVRVEPAARGKGAWGVFVNTPAMVTHGVGHPDWSHRSYALSGRRRGARPLPLRRGHAGGNPRPLHAAHRAPRAGADVEPRPLGVARVLQDARGSGRRRREAALAQNSLRRAGARRPRRRGNAVRVSISRGIRRASAIRPRRSRRSRRTTCGSARGSIRTCRSIRRCSSSSRRATIC